MKKTIKILFLYSTIIFFNQPALAMKRDLQENRAYDSDSPHNNTGNKNTTPTTNKNTNPDNNSKSHSDSTNQISKNSWDVPLKK